MNYGEGLYNKTLLHKRILCLCKRYILGSFNRKCMPLKYNVGKVGFRQNRFFNILSTCILDRVPPYGSLLCIPLLCFFFFFWMFLIPQHSSLLLSCPRIFFIHHLTQVLPLSNIFAFFLPIPALLSPLWNPLVLLSFFQYCPQLWKCFFLTLIFTYLFVSMNIF